MFKTDRYMLNALFLSFWFLGTMVLVTLGLWLLVLAFCYLARGPWLCMRPCMALDTCRMLESRIRNLKCETSHLKSETRWPGLRY